MIGVPSMVIDLNSSNMIMVSGETVHGYLRAKGGGLPLADVRFNPPHPGIVYRAAEPGSGNREENLRNGHCTPDTLVLICKQLIL